MSDATLGPKRAIPTHAPQSKIHIFTLQRIVFEEEENPRRKRISREKSLTGRGSHSVRLSAMSARNTKLAMLGDWSC